MDAADAAVRERELDRLLTFVDAAIAIALTLLVLPLAELPNEIVKGGDVSDLIRENQAEFWSFLLSFWVVAQLWLAQHRAMRHVRLSHHAITSLLLVWTLSIVFLPFPTALLPVTGGQAMTKILYIGTMIVSVALVGAIAYVIERNPQITDGHQSRDLGGAVAMAGLLILALAIMLLFPTTGYYPLLLLFLGGPIAVRIERGRARRRVTKGSGRVR